LNKLTYNYVKKEVENRGYILSSNEYTGYYQKLDIICDKGHNYKTSWNVFRTGSICPICYRKNQSKSMLKDFYVIKKYIESKGYILLSTKDDYKGNYSKLKTLCNNGHKIFVTWAEFKRGRRCPICSRVAKKNIEEIKQYVEQFGYLCLSKVYKNWKSKLKFRCPKGHIYETTWAIFQQGSRCSECNKIKLSINNSGPNCNFWKGGISYEPYCYEWIPSFKEIIKERDGFKCLNPYCTDGKGLTVHHINYNKKHCKKENLITICRSCNSKANKDRRWHKKWYQTILFRRYNYNYQEEIKC